MQDPTRPKAFHFVEASAFSSIREDYLDDDGMWQLQTALSDNPESGDLIPGTGGVRKLRWRDARRGKGKRGGLRVIYYCFLSDEEIWLLTLYDKNQAVDLTKSAKEQLKRTFESERAARKERARR